MMLSGSGHAVMDLKDLTTYIHASEFDRYVRKQTMHCFIKEQLIQLFRKCSSHIHKTDTLYNAESYDAPEHTRTLEDQNDGLASLLLVFLLGTLALMFFFLKQIWQ